MGADKWLAAADGPETISDSVCDKRLGQYPTLNMQPVQALLVFPDRPQVAAVAEGKVPYPRTR